MKKSSSTTAPRWFFRKLVGLLGFIMLLSSCGGNSGAGQAQKDTSLFVQEALAQSNAPTPGEANDQLYNSRQTAITRAVAHVSPAVVGINVIQVQHVVSRHPFLSDPTWQLLFPELYRQRVYERKVESLGSGFIISPDGYIITNQHVVENATEILVTLTDGKQIQADLVGMDKLTDIAVLKIDGKDHPYIELGNSEDLLVGEWVIALGNPFGLFELNDKPTVTVGVISAVDRDWGRTSDDRLYLDMIQTDAAINHGNSGGPLVNSLGQVIGMNTFIYTGSKYNDGSVGIGFAIPINRIRQIFEEIKVKGNIERDVWIGIYDVRTLSPEIVSALQLNTERGVIVTQLDRNGPAYRAGLRMYDVITAVEGQSVGSREEFAKILENMPLEVGQKLRFSVVRDNKPITVTVKLEPLPKRR